MSIAILLSVHDGLVLAADSASTLILTASPGFAGVGNVYNNANKIFNLYKWKPLGCIAYGAGSIGNASLATLIKDLRSQLAKTERAKEIGFDPENYTMEQVAKIVANFLGEECKKVQTPGAQLTMDIGLLLGGYSSGESLGEAWSVEIQKGIPKDPIRLREKDQVGISWGGASEVLQRIVLGFSPAIFQVLADVGGPGRRTSFRRSTA